MKKLHFSHFQHDKYEYISTAKPNPETLWQLGRVTPLGISKTENY